MICLDCKIEMRKVTTDYQYTESGLKNVVLTGISAYECPKCKEVSPVIKNIKKLHRHIAEKLVSKESLLTGKELAFLRKEMKIKAKDLAQMFALHKVTISRWENEKEKISPTIDRLIRILYETRVIRERCGMLKPEIEKLKPTKELSKLQDNINALCTFPTQTEELLKYIKNRQVRSKISISARDLGKIHPMTYFHPSISP